MPQPTPKLNYLLRRWWWWAFWVRQTELFLCACLGASGAAAVMLLTAASFGVAPTGARLLAGLTPLAVLAAAGGWALSRRNLRGRWAIYAAAASIGWALAWVSARSTGLRGPGLLAAWPAPMLLGQILLAWVAATVLAAMRSLRLTEALPAWLDRHADSKLLLATGGELGRTARPLSNLEQVVVDRAESLAGRPERFRGLSARRLSGRWWGLLVCLVLAAVLADWLGRQTRPPLEAGPVGPGGPQGSVTSTSSTLGQLAVVAGRQPDAAIAQAIQTAAAQLDPSADPAQARAALEASRAELADAVARAQPVLAALGELADQPTGERFMAVLVDPSRSTEQAVAAAAEQGRQWQAKPLSADERLQLAERLRRSAARLGATDKALAEALTRLADALTAERWPEVLAQLELIVRQVQPIARGRQLARSAMRAIDDALSKLPATTQPAGQQAFFASVSSAPPPSRAHRDWLSGRNEAMLEAGGLSAERQRLVRRYFAASAEPAGTD